MLTRCRETHNVEDVMLFSYWNVFTEGFTVRINQRLSCLPCCRVNEDAVFSNCLIQSDSLSPAVNNPDGVATSQTASEMMKI